MPIIWRILSNHFNFIFLNELDLVKIRLFILFLCVSTFVDAQQTVVSGKVTERETGVPIPFANVIFLGTSEGTITDFDGNFIAKTDKKVDSVEVRYIGFIRRAKPVKIGEGQVLNFQLAEDVQTLGEVVVYAGENPAWPIMRKVIAHKKQNDKRSLKAYEYESYTKLEIDVDNISSKLKNRKFVQKITNVLDSIQQISGEDGKPILPVFISEAISKYYHRNNPEAKYENILKTKVSGVGITDGTLTSQVIGTTLYDYNFYRNWLTIVKKAVASPISDNWKLYYELFLEDSAMINGQFCYRMDFIPKREQDLAFVGTMWITKENYALKRIDATIPKEANINYIEKIKIQQDLIQTAAGPWLPEKTRIVVDISEVTKQTAGLLAKLYFSTKDHVVNRVHENEFYMSPVTMEEDVRTDDESYWEGRRHDPLTGTEVNVYHMIDSMKQIPIVKNYIDVAKFVVGGYFRIGKIDFGPYTTFTGNNDIEGARLGFGGRTTADISRHWTLGGYFGYGFKDQEWKYKYYIERILSRKKWFTVRFEQQKEVEQIWMLNEHIEPNSLFYTLSRYGNLVQPFKIYKYRLSGYRQLGAGLGGSLAFKHETFDPYDNFQFYKHQGSSSPISKYEVSEVQLQLRYAKDEVFVIDDNERVSLGISRKPAFDFNYIYGFNGLLGSDYEYHKLKLSIEKKLKLGFFGISDFKCAGGYIFGELPYTLLDNTIGNQTTFYVDFAYNMMNYFEFSNDRYVELRYRHRFEGFVLNTIPLMKKLKWRLVGSANVMYGGMTNQHEGLAQILDGNEEEGAPYYRMDHRPYVELGYGIENILKILSIEAFHRLTYLEHQGVNRFGVKFSIQFIL